MPSCHRQPCRQVAVVAALRSSAFACSDVELLEFVEAGGEFNYFRPSVTVGPVADSLEALRRFHNRRLWVPIDQLIEQFIRERCMAQLAFVRRRPRERWRRLRSLWSRPAARPIGRKLPARFSGLDGSSGRGRGANGGDSGAGERRGLCPGHDRPRLQGA